MRRFILSGVVALLGPVVFSAPNTRPLPEEEFWRQPAMSTALAPASFDRALLATAIFHESNRIRRQLGLRPFLRLPQLDEAADLEAAVGRVYRPPSHTNPFPLIGTPLERVKYVGLKPRQVAENIALLPILDISLDLGVGVTVRDGRRLFVHPETQEELKPSTYGKFAAALVQGWMDSPPHRANIANPELIYLGCSAQPTTNLLGVEQLFCVQVFFTPAH